MAWKDGQEVIPRMPDIMNRRRLLQALALLGAGAFSLRSAHASDDDDDDDGGKGSKRRRRQDHSLRPLPAGSKNLQSILDQVRNEFSGRIIEVELDEDDGQLVYEIKLLDNKGRLFEIYADARDGRILKVERD
jgi:uncharacterized membrane protein YkoI